MNSITKNQNLLALRGQVIAAVTSFVQTCNQAVVGCKAAIKAAVDKAKAARVPDGEIASWVKDAYKEAGAYSSYVSAMLVELGLRERAERNDKGTAKAPHAKAVLQDAVKLCDGDYAAAAKALLAAYRLAKKHA